MRIQWTLHLFPCRLKEWIWRTFEEGKLFILSLCYNSFASFSYVVEASFEPMFWFVDHFARFLGPLFMTMVVILTTSVVTVVYTCFFPHRFHQTDYFWTAFHMTCAHWLLLNLVYNYFMAAFTDPGVPSQHITEVVSICKKCISPKPPRTHHCTVCQRCVLKMDHHCPWLNNCVGYYNHRYFFLFCLYMTLGTIYTSTLGYEMFKKHFYGEKDLKFPGALYPLNAAYDFIYRRNTTAKKIDFSDSSFNSTFHFNKDNRVTFKDQYLHNAVVFNFILCSGVAVALGGLTLYHASLICKGETSIEVHINNKERKRLKAKKLVFRNPYNFGVLENWRIFLGLTEGRSVLYVLFPSVYRPEGNGQTWRKNVGPFVQSRKPQVV